ncbi:MAG: YfcC family protein [Bacteroidetes bacterium]|jgi:uncharacterized ion transporter superfamily protein YfcC|nr:YfcC family protein [Bacteroidota bacterium]
MNQNDSDMKFPSALTILMMIAAMVAALTWLIPAGNYDSLVYHSDDDSFTVTSNDGSSTFPASQEMLDNLGINIPLGNFTSGAIYRPVSVPGSYQQVAAAPQGLYALAMSPVKGIIDAADIIFLVLIIGGLIGVMNLTGAFNAGIAWLGNALEGREYVLIILTTTLVAFGGTTFGFAEETIALYLILIPVFIAAGYDALVGFACIYLGSTVGSMCSTINPFSVIIASDSAGIIWTEGIYARSLMFVICITITVLFILRYANKVKKDPGASLLYKQKDEIEEYFGLNTDQETQDFDVRRILILTVFMGCFVSMIAGVLLLDWWFIEMTTVFLVGAILIGFIAQIHEATFGEAFVKGAGDLLGVAFLIGIARGVSILMNDGLISDTILYHAASATEGMNDGLIVNAMFLIYNGLFFLVPSSSGMAVLTMPIFAPLADTTGFGREMIVNTYLYGQLVLLVIPTGLLLPSLEICKIGLDRYLRFIWPLIFVLMIVIMISLTLQVSL